MSEVLAKKVEIGVYRMEPESYINLGEVDIGPLVFGLTEEPYYFAGAREGGAITIQIQRTHEFEIILDIALVGGGVFLPAR